jgi:hypothetical protein
MTESDPHDQPEPHLGLIIWAAILAVLSALLTLAVALRPPPINVLIAVSLTSVSFLVIAGVIVLVWVVLRISQSFGIRYDRTAQFVEESHTRIEALLVANGAKLDDMLCITDLVRGVVDEEKRQEILAALEDLKQQHDSITGAVDELREAFIEEGLPGHHL